MVLALYMEEESSPLPTCEEVLFCNQLTTEEEVRDNHVMNYFCYESRIMSEVISIGCMVMYWTCMLVPNSLPHIR